MKIKLLICIGCLTSLFAKAQDVIILQTGEEIQSKIIEIGTSELKYKKTESGPLYVLKKEEIFMIKYEDGTKDVFNTQISNNKEVKLTQEDKPSVQQLMIKGRQNAESCYRGVNCGAGGTAVTTLVFSGIIGLIPAVICSSMPPSDFNLLMPQNSYSSYPEYINSYKDEAFRIKKRKIWTAWGVSVGVNLVFLAMLYR